MFLMITTVLLLYLLSDAYISVFLKCVFWNANTKWNSSTQVFHVQESLRSTIGCIFSPLVRLNTKLKLLKQNKMKSSCTCLIHLFDQSTFYFQITFCSGFWISVLHKLLWDTWVAFQYLKSYKPSATLAYTKYIESIQYVPGPVLPKCQGPE